MNRSAKPAIENDNPILSRFDLLNEVRMAKTMCSILILVAMLHLDYKRFYVSSFFWVNNVCKQMDSVKHLNKRQYIPQSMEHIINYYARVTLLKHKSAISCHRSMSLCSTMEKIQFIIIRQIFIAETMVSLL